MNRAEDVHKQVDSLVYWWDIHKAQSLDVQKTALIN